MEMKVLIMGWSKIPHSYSIVNVFQMVHLYEKFFPEIKLYIQEQDYYRQEWSQKTSRTLYPESYYTILDSIEPWVGQDIDLIYSITYPYNINSLKIQRNGQLSSPIPKCVFYTSEFGKLDPSYFTLATSGKIIDDDFIQEYIDKNKHIFFTSPSEWSSQGMKRYLVNDTVNRNQIISHGVDTRIFNKIPGNKTRNAIRKFYNVSKDDILLCNIGAMTRNKGIVQILQALKVLVIDKGLVKYKLLLKGMEDLYATRQFIDIYLKELNLPKSLCDNIIFIDKTLSYTKLNEIYNSIDLYLSPYIAEGFNLVPLEVMSSGTKVILPRGGSTKEYSDALEQFGCIEFVKCQFDKESGQNVYSTNDIIDAILKGSGSKSFDHSYVTDFIARNLSWNNAASQLKDYFQVIIGHNT